MTVNFEISSGIGWVKIDNPPVNATSQSVRAGLIDAISYMEAKQASAVLLECAGRTFIAGADLREVGKPAQAPLLPDVVQALEATPVPWISLIHGAALGGGLEIALGCAYRIVVETARLGLPEVTLGLIPGAGGTVRLPRMIDPFAALDMIASGKPVTADRACELGLVDRVAAKGDLIQAGLSFAAEITKTARPVPCGHRDAIMPDNPTAWQLALQKAKARAKGQNATIVAVDTVDFAVHNSAEDAFLVERQAFLKLKDDRQSAALRYLFFAERSVSKSERAQDAKATPIAQIGVVGGGTMGSGIAAACLLAGLPVTMLERDAISAKTGQGRVSSILDGAVKRGKLSDAAHVDAMACFSTATNYMALRSANVVIEAVFEEMDVKRAVFAELDRVTSSQALLASNTSYLDVANLAQQTAHPERVIGLHFFSPAHVMKLLEVIIPDGANATAVATGMALGKRLGKITVPAGVCDGFIGNRIMSAYRCEADYMIVDGALPQDVDKAMRDFGFPIGIFQMQDLAGLDIAWAMRKRKAATRSPSERYVEVADRLCEAGRFGRKTGKGWYDYGDNEKGAVDPVVTQSILDESAANGIARKPLNSAEIMARLLGVMQAEGRVILDEGIAESAAAIDVVMVNGYGFPGWRGGPMFMTEQA